LLRRVSRVAVGFRRGLAVADPPVIAISAPPGAPTGPTVAVLANVHGDEVQGVVAAHALADALEGRLTSGSVVLYPSCNPQGLSLRTRHVPPDDTDLNRLFPGNPRGLWSAKLAAALWRDLTLRQPDVVIDLHSDSANAIPYVIVDRPVRLPWDRRRALGERMEALARATGLTVLREYPDDAYLQYGLDHSLAGAVVNQLGVPALTLEVGPRRSVDAAAVATMRDAVMGVLAALGVVPGVPSTPPSAVPAGPWRRAPGPRAKRAGLVMPRVPVGAVVAAGAPVADVVGLDGAVEETVLATDTGLVVSWMESPWIEAGGVLLTLGLMDGERL
jgi:predicted deacylase